MNEKWLVKISKSGCLEVIKCEDWKVSENGTLRVAVDGGWQFIPAHAYDDLRIVKVKP